MDANVFRHFYEYHFTENRKIWDTYITVLTQEQFTKPVAYSMGSVRNHIVHLMSVDEAWFSDLRGVQIPQSDELAASNDLKFIRAYWDNVEQTMRDYLAKLSADKLFEKPFASEEDKDLVVWQALLQVANHGTDHRAQLLHLLNDLGLKTGPQDYIFYVYEHM